MGKTKIEWCDKVWNPVTGCTPISEGCQNCYAERMARRLAGRFGYPMRGGFAVTLHEDKIEEPAKWVKPRRIFVCSMADLFHEDVDEQWIRDIFHIMDIHRRHTYLLLTKRPGRMAAFIRKDRLDMAKDYPHVWLGVTAENQARADERIPILLQIPAAKRFVSIEPMLGPIYAYPYLGCTGMPDCLFCETAGKKLDWIILGQETGPGARKAEWFNSIIGQCKSAGVPVFVKKSPEGV